ncbi:uncharacterized protein LOC143935450 [Lithobates pipiens]
MMICKASFFLIFLHAVPPTDANAFINITQQEIMNVEAGQSVNITCSFVFDSPSFTAKWTRGCNHSVSLSDQTCYNGRISSNSDLTTESGTLCYKINSILTIVNVLEIDSGIYCCHIQTVRGQMGIGSGTRLEVIQRKPIQEKNPTNENMQYILYAVVGVEACIILVLLIVVVKFCHKGSTQVVNQVFEDESVCEGKLHYAEICQSKQSNRVKGRHSEEKVTYAPVKLR